MAKITDCGWLKGSFSAKFCQHKLISFNCLLTKFKEKLSKFVRNIKEFFHPHIIFYLNIPPLNWVNHALLDPMQLSGEYSTKKELYWWVLPVVQMGPQMRHGIFTAHPLREDLNPLLPWLHNHKTIPYTCSFPVA